jgi:hypothetical protein
VGWTTEAFVELFCTAGPPRRRSRRHPADPEVVGAYTVSGQADALVHLRAADIGHLEQALGRLRAEPFVTSTRSMVVLSRLVETPTPVPHRVRPEPRRGHPRPSPMSPVVALRAVLTLPPARGCTGPSRPPPPPPTPADMGWSPSTPAQLLATCASRQRPASGRTVSRQP